MEEVKNNFKKLYKKAFKEWVEAIEIKNEKRRSKEFDEMDEISTMYVKVMHGITYRETEKNILQYVTCDEFVKRQFEFEEECKKEFYNESEGEK